MVINCSINFTTIFTNSYLSNNINHDLCYWTELLQCVQCTLNELTHNRSLDALIIKD